MSSFTRQDFIDDGNIVETHGLRFSHPLLTGNQAYIHYYKDVQVRINNDVVTFQAHSLNFKYPDQSQKPNQQYGLVIDDVSQTMLAQINSLLASDQIQSIGVEFFLFLQHSLSDGVIEPNETLNLEINSLSWNRGQLIAQARGIDYSAIRFPRNRYLTADFPGLIP